MKRMIEFYSGSGVMAAAFRDRGWRAITVDLYQKADYHYNILAINREDIVKMCGGEPDFMWFGTPCEGFSVAAIGRN